MVDYRPDVSELWGFIRGHFPLIRRIALAIGGMMLAYGIAKCLGTRGTEGVGSAAIGGAIIGFFAPAVRGGGDIPIIGGDEGADF